MGKVNFLLRSEDGSYKRQYFRGHAQRCFPSSLFISFQNTPGSEHQIGSNFCYLTRNKRERAHIFPKHPYSTALPPFWMTNKGDKCNSNTLSNRRKAKLKPDQKVRINPGSAPTTEQREQWQIPRSWICDKIWGGKRKGKLAALHPEQGTSVSFAL